MSSNGRWRRIRIVEISGKNRWSEIVGGLKNALERGETLDKAKQSFMNSGYTFEEVEMAAQKVPSGIGKPLSGAIQEPAFGNEKNKTSKKVKIKKEKKVKTGKPLSKSLVIALVVLSILVIGGAIYIGLNFDTFFK